METKFKNYWEGITMLFHLPYVMDPKYNLEGTQPVVQKISTALILKIQLYIVI